MTNVIRLDRRHAGDDAATAATLSIGALRTTTGMEADEFVDALGQELGWPIPLFVYHQWETAGSGRPPAEVLRAARTVSLRSPIGSREPSLSRRQFIAGVVGLSSFAAASLPVATQPLAGPLLGAADVRHAGAVWRSW